MKGLKIFLLITAGCLMAGSLHADIYEWTDENGVKHYSNYAPPDNATILMKTRELPYDEAADRARMEADRQYQLELARLEIAEREAQVRLREAEAEQKAAEAERYSQETMREVDEYLKKARNQSYQRSGGYYGYYFPPYVHPYKGKYTKKSHYWHAKKKYDSRFYRKKYTYPRKYQSPDRLRIRSHSPRGAYRLNARSTGHPARRHERRGSYGYRR